MMMNLLSAYYTKRFVFNGFRESTTSQPVRRILEYKNSFLKNARGKGKKRKNECGSARW